VREVLGHVDIELDRALDPDWLEAGLTPWLRSGDLLYVRRGVVHALLAGTQGSLYLTLGVRHMLWHDVLVEALRRLAGTDGACGSRDFGNTDLGADVPHAGASIYHSPVRSTPPKSSAKADPV